MKHKKKGNWLMTGGLLLIAAALLLTCYNLWDERRASASAREVLQELDAVRPEEPETGNPATADPGEVEIPDYILDPNREMPVTKIDGGAYIGVLSLPSLGLELPVMETWNDPNLRIAPCRYSGSAYPDDLIICGPNYTSHFGHLKDLQAGDIASFTDMDGNVFTYKMVERETLEPTAIAAMKSGDWDLTLFTCTLGGQSRMTVRFKLAMEE